MLKEFFLGDKKPQLNQEVLNILRLIRSENIGNRTFFALIKLFGNAKNALDNIEDFSLRGGRSKPIKIYSQEAVDRELELLTKNNAHLVAYNSNNYSYLLSQINDYPPILSYKGNIKLLSDPNSIAIVGSRNASINGRSFTSNIAKKLTEFGYNIVSGLARGIDTAAHVADTSKTIAVIAGGIDNIYPQENHLLYHKIAEEGLIVAELPVGTSPLAQHFPQRNRIISGLSLATVIVEANLKSGSLITAKFALEQNREIFAVPGFPLDPRAQGTNKLIKQGAYLLESYEDIIHNLPNYNVLKQSLFDSTKDDFKAIENGAQNQINLAMRQEILNLLSITPIEFDDLLKATDFSLQIVYIILLELELAGKIARHPGNRFSLIF